MSELRTLAAAIWRIFRKPDPIRLPTEVNDGVMKILREKRVRPAGLYCNFEPGAVRRRPLPEQLDHVYPIHKRARR